MPWLSLLRRSARCHPGRISPECAFMGGGLLLTIAVIGIGFGPALDAVAQRVHVVLDASSTDAPAPPQPLILHGG